MQSPEPTLFSAKDIMTTDIVSVRLDTTIEEAVALFEQHRVSGLPVVDHRRHLLGILTEYDLLRSIGGLQMRGTVADFMTRDVISVDETTPLPELIDIFIDTRVRRLPITREGRLLGVISRRDLLFAGNIRQQLLTELPVLASAGRGA